jgi:hypothetical protein
MSTQALMIFTSQNPDSVFKFGGSQSWRLNPQRACLYEYAILTQNRKVMGFPESRPTAPDKQAFMVGKISGVEPSVYPGSAGRYLIKFSKYALINDPGVTWMGERNPVLYTTIEDAGIDLSKLDFKPMPHLETPAASQTDALREAALTQAKAGLAAALGISPSQVEIKLRT